MAQTNIEETLYAQMHEQYLKNDSDKTKTIISFLGAIAFVFTAYGYVYSYPALYTEKLQPFFIFILLYSTLASYLMFSLLAILSVNIGYSSRKEHLTVHHIRYLNLPNYERYSFFWKKHEQGPLSWCSFLPNYYRLFFIFSNLTIILFCIATIHLDFSLRNLDANVKVIFDEAGITIWPFVIAGCILALTINMIVYGRYYHKYKKEKNKHHEKK